MVCVCSRTVAGILTAYYDIHGYRAEGYANLVPGGVAELSTFPSVGGSRDYRVQSVIASSRPVGDFYPGGYLAFGDDLVGASSGSAMVTTPRPANNACTGVKANTGTCWLA